MITRYVFERTLIFLGCEVTALEKSIDAIHAIHDSAFDLIILEFDGAQTVERAREVLGKTVPIVVITATPAKAKEKLGQTGLVNAIYPKPFDSSQFARLLAQFVPHLPAYPKPRWSS